MVRIKVRTGAPAGNLRFFGLATHDKIVILRGPKGVYYRGFSSIFASQGLLFVPSKRDGNWFGKAIVW